jgi:prefoldin subunit 5
MVEYSFEEANELLTKNLESAKKSLATIEEDLDFLKDQITTTEVSIL